MRRSTMAFPSYSKYTTAQLLHAYQEGAHRMVAVIEGLSENELRTRTRGPGSWSIHEIVMHSADSEIQGAYRMRKAISESGADLPGYDQDLWARELGYQALPASARMDALDLLRALRRIVAPALLGATDDVWRRSGFHPEYGELSLRNLLELYADHTERHISQILGIRESLGRPLDFPLLLPDRLY